MSSNHAVVQLSYEWQITLENQVSLTLVEAFNAQLWNSAGYGLWPLLGLPFLLPLQFLGSLLNDLKTKSCPRTEKNGYTFIDVDEPQSRNTLKCQQCLQKQPQCTHTHTHTCGRHGFCWLQDERVFASTTWAYILTDSDYWQRILAWSGRSLLRSEEWNRLLLWSIPTFDGHWMTLGELVIEL